MRVATPVASQFSTACQRRLFYCAKMSQRPGISAITNPKYCSVPSCVRDPTHSCFLLPRNHRRARLWMDLCGIKKKCAGKIMICEAHFSPTSINHTINPKQLARGALPNPTRNCITSAALITSHASAQHNIRDTKSQVEIANTNKKIEESRQVYMDNYIEKVITKSLNIQPSQPNKNVPTDVSISAGTTNNRPNDIELMDVQSPSIKLEEENNDNSVSATTEPKTVELSSIMHNEASNCTKSATQDNFNVNYLNNAARTITEIQRCLQEHSDACKMLAVKVYLQRPEGYKLLQKTLQLPPVSKLKSILDGCTISTDNKTFASLLQFKSETMTVKQKQCILCLGAIDVSESLYYDIKRDTLVGVSNINKIQKPAVAHTILVLFLQGIYSSWKQPIDIAYLSTPRRDNLVCIDQFIGKNIDGLLRTGFGVHALVCEPDDLLRTTSPNLEKYRKVYYINDIVTLLKHFLYTFRTHDFKFGCRIAKMQDILLYFELDSKNTPRLSQGLSEKTLNPATVDDIDANDVKEIISLKTAAAMTIYINFQALNPMAKYTVELLTKMGMLLEVIYSDKCDDTSKETFKRVLLETISFLDKKLIVIDKVTKKVVAAEETFLPKLVSTVRAILMLNEDLKCYSVALPVKRLSLEKIRSFFKQIRLFVKDGTKPTCKKVYLAFIQSALLSVLKPIPGQIREPDLESNLNAIKNMLKYSNFLFIRRVTNPLPFAIKCSEYNTLDLKNKDTIILLAGFLLKKCYDQHPHCDEMKNYIFIVLQDTSAICKTILKEIQESVCVVPQESFIEFVEMMEIRFRSFMTKPILETQVGLIKGLLDYVQPITFPMPCPCFPLLYAKTLYLRVRIFNMLKYNNHCFSAFPEQYENLIVNDL